MLTWSFKKKICLYFCPLNSKVLTPSLIIIYINQKGKKKIPLVFTAEVDLYCRSAAAGAYFVKKP